MKSSIRRNRNIGKTQGGRVKDGRPREKPSRIVSRDFWSRISEEAPTTGFGVLIDNPSRNYIHPLSEDDVRNTLDRLPARLVERCRAVVMPRMCKSDVAHEVEAKRRYACIVLNPFPKDLQVFWTVDPPSELARRHYAPWKADWRETARGWYQSWTLGNLRRYYLYHLLLHELGHLNEPPFHDSKRRESYAEDFALTWARKLNELPRRRRSNV